jgi:hypothetical protein
MAQRNQSGAGARIVRRSTGTGSLLKEAARALLDRLCRLSTSIMPDEEPSSLRSPPSTAQSGGRRCLRMLDKLSARGRARHTGYGREPVIHDLRLATEAGRHSLTGVRPQAHGFAALPSSPPSRTSCARRFTTACRWSSNKKPGRFGLGSSLRMPPRSRLKALLAPFLSEAMICWPVSARGWNVKNNDSSLIEPIAA